VLKYPAVVDFSRSLLDLTGRYWPYRATPFSALRFFLLTTLMSAKCLESDALYNP